MALKFIIFNPFPSNPSKISPPSQTLICSFNPNSSSSSSSSLPKKRILTARKPARDLIIDFGKHKGKMLGTLPSDYLKWVSKTLHNDDWGELADEVLKDPIYKDRIEWEFAYYALSGDREVLRRNENPAKSFKEISEEFGWDFDDDSGWGKVNFSLLGTSFGGRLPRKGEKKMDSLSKTRRERKSTKVVPVKGSVEERREKRRLKRGLQMGKVEISGMKKKEEEEDDDDDDDDGDDEDVRKVITPSKVIPRDKLFPGRGSLVEKAVNKGRKGYENESIFCVDNNLYSVDFTQSDKT